MTFAPGTTCSTLGLLFDMDGTLVDSGAVVERVWRHFAQRHGLEAGPLLEAIVGCRARDSVARFAAPGTDLAAETARVLAEELVDVDGIVPVPGADELLRSLPLDAWVLVTSADRELAERRMAAAGLPTPQFLVTGDQVAAGKPSPDGFLAGAHALGIPIADCLAFEDSPSGLVAAHAAGAGVVAVATWMTPSQLVQEHWIADFTGFRFQARHAGRLTFRIEG
jgi:sugar-phosphatase